MEELDIPQFEKGMTITQEDWNKLQESIRLIKFQLQENNDILQGGIRANNLQDFRNTYVINAQDSLDSSYPMYVHFNIIDEMVKIVSVKVDFWILNYRAYSTGASSGGGQTTSSGGGQTTCSGGGQTSSSCCDNYRIWSPGTLQRVTNVGNEGLNGYLASSNDGYYVADSDHTHTVSNHTHTVSNHTHTVSDHTHDVAYGIHEETNSPTIKFYVSENNGVSYSYVFGGYTTDQLAIDITSQITTAGSKIIKFTSDTRTRLSVQITVKLDIRAR